MSTAAAGRECAVPTSRRVRTMRNAPTEAAGSRLTSLVLVVLCSGCAAGLGSGRGGATKAASPTSAATATALELGQAFSEVAEGLRPSVVYVLTENPRPGDASFAALPFRPYPLSPTSSGTGFVVRSDGYVVTNHHVIAGARQVFVRLYDQREFPAEVVGADPLTDIAVLRISCTDLPVAPLGDSDRLRVGAWVLAIGNPLGDALAFSVTAGIVSAASRSLVGLAGGAQSSFDFIQTDAVTNSGNSGGPLVDLRGDVVGMNARIYSTTGTYQGYSLAIPASLIGPVVGQLIQHGRMKRAMLGIRIEEATREDAVAVGLEFVQGVVVQDAKVGQGGAFQAGLRAGDVIVAVDGEPVAHGSQLRHRIWFRSAGDTVALAVLREGGEQLVVHVPLVALQHDVAPPGGGDREPSPDAARPCSQNRLGVCVDEMDATETRSSIREDDDVGLVVRDVYPVGPSFGKLVPDADIITHVDGQRVLSIDDLEAILRESGPGTIVAVQTYRHRTGERGFTRVRLR